MISLSTRRLGPAFAVAFRRSDIRGIRAGALSDPQHHAGAAVRRRQRHRHHDAADRRGNEHGARPRASSSTTSPEPTACWPPPYVARAAPDGYTLFVTTNTTHSANPSLMKQLTYDPVKDFTPIARTGNLPFMLVIHPDVPAKTVHELTAYAKANPGKLTYATALVGGDRHGRDLCAARRPRPAARALQELAAGADRRDRRPRQHDVHRHSDRPAAGRRRQAARRSL